MDSKPDPAAPYLKSFNKHKHRMKKKKQKIQNQKDKMKKLGIEFKPKTKEESKEIEEQLKDWPGCPKKKVVVACGYNGFDFCGS